MGMDGPAIKYEARKHARSATCTAHNTAQDDTRQHTHHITQYNTRDKRKVTEKRTITAHPASYSYIHVLTVAWCSNGILFCCLFRRAAQCGASR